MEDFVCDSCSTDCCCVVRILALQQNGQRFEPRLWGCVQIHPCRSILVFVVCLFFSFFCLELSTSRCCSVFCDGSSCGETGASLIDGELITLTDTDCTTGFELRRMLTCVASVFTSCGLSCWSVQVEVVCLNPNMKPRTREKQIVAKD